jgi:hypothetical protein
LTLNNNHIGEDDIESYSMCLLSDESATLVEHHLLICEICRVRLVDAEEYIVAMKESVRNLPQRLQRTAKTPQAPSADRRVMRAGG